MPDQFWWLVGGQLAILVTAIAGVLAAAAAWIRSKAAEVEARAAAVKAAQTATTINQVKETTALTAGQVVEVKQTLQKNSAALADVAAAVNGGKHCYYDPTRKPDEGRA